MEYNNEKMNGWQFLDKNIEDILIVFLLTVVVLKGC